MRPDVRPASAASARAVDRTVLAALAVLLLTSAHHVYGAYAYGTPWRNHAAYGSGAAAVAIIASALALRQRPGGVAGTLAFGTLALVVFAFPVATIGLFEGGYNHALKNALFFGGASPEIMKRFFPPPTYEMPDDVVFEITGVLQLAAGIVAGRQLYRLVAARRAQRDTSILLIEPTGTPNTVDAATAAPRRHL